MARDDVRRLNALKDRIRDRDEPAYNPTVAEIAPQLRKIRHVKELLGDRGRIILLNDGPGRGRIHTYGQCPDVPVTDDMTAEQIAERINQEIDREINEHFPPIC